MVNMEYTVEAPYVQTISDDQEMKISLGKQKQKLVAKVYPCVEVKNSPDGAKSAYNSFIILDESQNTTLEQMKMFLTRIGFGSTAVITGDITQVDLPRGTKSGLAHVIEVLRDVPGITFTHFKPKDVVRHPLVQRIVEAYERFEERQPSKIEHRDNPRDA